MDPLSPSTTSSSPSSSSRPSRPSRAPPPRPPMPSPMTSGSDDPIVAPPRPDFTGDIDKASNANADHPLIDLGNDDEAHNDSAVKPEMPLPAAATPSNDPTAPTTGDDTTLTPLRTHYLKKALIALQFNRELTYISSTPLQPPLSVLSLLGPPFTPLPRSAFQSPNSLVQDIPFLRFMFRQFVLTFPFLASAPKDFFPNKLQPFLNSLLARNLSSELTLFPEEDSDALDPEHSGTAKALAKVEKHMALLLGSAVKLVDGEREEVVRLTQKDLDRLENQERRRARRAARENGGEGPSKEDKFGVNVVCVRTVSEKGRVRRRHHDEFVIRTRREDEDDLFVSRRYGDFRTLSDELRKHHPAEEVPAPPGKDRTSTTSGGTTIPAASRLRGKKSTSNLAFSSHNNNDLDDDLPPSPTTTSGGSISPSSPLQRERNRLTLRAYLNSLLTNRAIASSPVLRAFLTMDPIELTEEEEMDARRREELDAIREEGKNQFEREVSERVDKLREAVKGVQGDLMGPDGLTHVFSVIRSTPNVRDLPENFKAVLEWGRISLASTIFHHFIASDSGHESLVGLKRIHGLMPYFMLKGILRISNPVAMIRGVMDLFMATPFGGRSLLQRMFTTSLTEEVKELQEEIEAVKDKVDDDVMCDKIRQYIYAPKEIQQIYKADALEERANLLAVILRSAEEPVLNRPQMLRVARAARAHQAYIRSRMEADDSEDDEGPEDDDGWLFEDLGVLIRLYARLRDREQMIELIFEGTTADLLKDIITIFYAPLAQVYKAASIADSLGDLQNFINDLIKTVEQGEEMSQGEPSKTVELFIDLVGRHEQAFYTFVHKVQSKGEGLFDSLMRWIELFLTFVREGVSQSGERFSLEFLLPHTGEERAKIMKEVDDIALYHYKLKVAYEAKVRKRFLAQSGAAAEEELAAQAMVDNVISDLQFGSLIKGDTEEIYAEEEEEFTSDESSDEFVSDDETSTSETRSTVSSSNHLRPPPSTFSSPDPSPSHSTTSPPSAPKGAVPSIKTDFDKPLPPPPPSSNGKGHRRTFSRSSARSGKSTGGSSVGGGGGTKLRKVKRTGQAVIEPPELHAIPELLPIFVEMIRTHLQPRPLSTAT